MDNINYFQIPEERLGVLLDLEFKRLWNQRTKIKDNWIKNNKCICVGKLKQGKVLRCEHIKKEIKEKTKETSERIQRMTNVSIIRGLVKAKLV